MSNRFSRIIAGVFLAAAVASVLWSRATGVLSTSAIIYAPIVSIRAPFDGSVEEASKRRDEAVSKGDPLITLAATERSEFDLTTLKSERDALEGRIESLGNRIRKTRALKASLVERFAEEIEVEIAHLGSRIEAASARLTASRARRDRVAADLDRAVALEERSAVAESRVEDLRLQIAAQTACRVRPSSSSPDH